MEVQDGFIVGIYNYCDRWCEACALTSRCRAFASMVQDDAARDPVLQPVANAPPLPVAQPKPAAWVTALIREVEELALSSEAAAVEPHPIHPRHRPIEARANAYGTHVYRWLKTEAPRNAHGPSDPMSVIVWFSHYIPGKIHRALFSLANDEPTDREWPADHDGSAKAALLAIERSHVAWLQLVERGEISRGKAEAYLRDLVFLGEELERVFPGARGFVRPGFDEPADVARLEAQERR